MEEPGAAGASSQMIQCKLYKKVSQENVCNEFLSVIKILKKKQRLNLTAIGSVILWKKTYDFFFISTHLKTGY